MFSVPLFCSRRTPCGIGTLSLPLGPSTRSSSPMVSFTPEGTGMGFLPILDITKSLLPDLTDQFAADVFLAGVTAGHKTSWSCQDVYAEAAEHSRDLFRAHVNAATGTGNTFNLRNRRLILRSVLEIETNHLQVAFVSHFVIQNVAFVLQDSGQFHLHFRRGDVHFLVACRECVSHARQHVSDGIRWCHASFLFLLTSAGGKLRRESPGIGVLNPTAVFLSPRARPGLLLFTS